MGGWEYAIWGLFGGFAVEGLEFSGAIRRTGDWPWRSPGEPGPLPLLASVVIRLGVGSGLAVAAGITGQVSGPFGALAIGVAAPLLVEQITRALPATAPPRLPAGLPAPEEPMPAERRGSEVDPAPGSAHRELTVHRGAGGDDD
ncbi:hypothetical protein FHR81_000760 [Actinoalloteichus hoggarensis]|uniref:Uncharacterized protein n=1 Tax=Actinoalloteichus hoggarensis TaxID=1470176 RepID=A0A221W1C0_9PSEU|nr:hypothetical protein [Actinoalloteichus hoggarensis]ASO19562.1 hypothetical protein AHOG_09590 [Actinoalloteichus hoggarensis]MBB5919731.1 hypothetical protein [Actinoalloteichus hoggarensis]